VIDFILERAEVTERRVPVADLLKDDEDEAAEGGTKTEAKAEAKAAGEKTEATSDEAGKKAKPKKSRAKKKSE
jgi:hypothetical protein